VVFEKIQKFYKVEIKIFDKKAKIFYLNKGDCENFFLKFYIWEPLMLCPCPVAAAIGGSIGSYFGISPPEGRKGKLVSTLMTSVLVSITAIALKAFLNISLCGGGGFTLGNIFRVVIKTVLMGIIYSIVVNYFLTRYFFSPQKKCCCK
jgi:hypothetical protein